ncbi:MAG: hypothetical protein AAFY78_00755 [Cyanobacteria bacterium J06648_16]
MPGLIGLVVLGGYGYVAWRFWSGFRRTNFSQGRLYLTLLWPVFVVASAGYRQNFSRALKGS